VAGATAATGFLGGIFVMAVFAVGLRAGGFGATATGMAGFGGAASSFVAGAMAATGFLGGVFVIAVLVVGLRAGNLATLALVAGALVAGARFAAIVLANLFAADVFAADFFVVFFAAATFFVFSASFAIVVSRSLRLTFRITRGNQTRFSSGCNGTVGLSTKLRPVGCVGAADIWLRVSPRSGCHDGIPYKGMACWCAPSGAKSKCALHLPRVQAHISRTAGHQQRTLALAVETLHLHKIRSSCAHCNYSPLSS
jgi:hypothetical protein